MAKAKSATIEASELAVAVPLGSTSSTEYPEIEETEPLELEVRPEDVTPIPEMDQQETVVPNSQGSRVASIASKFEASAVATNNMFPVGEGGSEI